MITFDERTFQEDLSKIKVWLSHAQKEIPFAMAFTLTKMGQAGKAEATNQLSKIFKDPTPWTMKSIFLTAAKKDNLVAVVYVKDGSRASLLHHITGGQRPEKGYEYQLRRHGILKGSNQYTTIGHGAKKNKYGNLTMGTINKVVSSVGAQLDDRANTTANSLKRNSTQKDYFIVKRSSGTPAGIYEKVGGGANQRLRPVLVFVKSTTYRRKYPFHEVVEDAGYDAMDQAIEDVLEYVFSK